MTHRWKLTLEYDGTHFAGWQIQENGFSVQECLETAVFRFSGERVTSHVAGRTDSGVHATGQVAHIDLEKNWEAKTVRDAINYHMRPHACAVVEALPVSPTFHARFDAKERAYCYKILTGRKSESVLDKGRVWHAGWDLDVAAMNDAASVLIGKHDFSSFRASECQAKSPVRTLDKLFFIDKESLSFGHHIEMWAEARSFLHHQIRNMVGTLVMVGQGKWSRDDVKNALEAKNRSKAGVMAPAAGLYFVRVVY